VRWVGEFLVAVLVEVAIGEFGHGRFDVSGGGGGHEDRRIQATVG